MTSIHESVPGRRAEAPRALAANLVGGCALSCPGSACRWARTQAFRRAGRHRIPVTRRTGARDPANVVLTADGCEEPQLAGTSDRRGAIGGTELGVDAADLRADRVRRDGQFAGDLVPGQVRRAEPQDPELARAELF